MQRRYPPGGPPHAEAYVTPPVSGGRLSTPPENAEAARQLPAHVADAISAHMNSMIRMAAALVGLAETRRMPHRTRYRARGKRGGPGASSARSVATAHHGQRLP